MDPLRKTLLDLLRLGLSGDVESVRQLGLRLLRHPPGEGEQDGEFREALSRLLLGASNPGRATRAAAARDVRPAQPVRNVAPPASQLVRVVATDDAPRPALPPETQAALEQVIFERGHLDALHKAGLEPTRSILLTGAPGVGKTMAARYLAREVGLPLVAVDLASVVSSYLGRTGQNLREALDAAKGTPSVLLIDEFDALAKRRDDPSDVGELKRIVNVLLLELEHWPAHGLLVAATNHPELLDRAIWRRFDRVISVPLPGVAERTTILCELLARFDQRVEPALLEQLARVSHGVSGSDLARAVSGVARTAALHGSEPVIGELLTHALLARLRDDATTDRAARAEYVGLATDVLGQSARAIATDLGLSHPTVLTLLKEYRASSGTSAGGRSDGTDSTMRSAPERGGGTRRSRGRPSH